MQFLVWHELHTSGSRTFTSRGEASDCTKLNWPIGHTYLQNVPPSKKAVDDKRQNEITDGYPSRSTRGCPTTTEPRMPRETRPTIPQLATYYAASAANCARRATSGAPKSEEAQRGTPCRRYCRPRVNQGLSHRASGSRAAHQRDSWIRFEDRADHRRSRRRLRARQVVAW